MAVELGAIDAGVLAHQLALSTLTSASSAVGLAATMVSSRRQFGARQPIQADPLLGSQQRQIAVDQWWDAHAELAAVILFGQRYWYGFTTGQHVGHYVGLAEATEHPAHHFWPDAFSLLTPGCVNWKKLLSGRHLTDAYLLALAVKNDGFFVTLDKGIPLSAVQGAQDRHLVVLNTQPPALAPM